MEKIARVSLFIRLLIVLVACLNMVVITVAILTKSESSSAELAVGTAQSFITQVVSSLKSSESFAKELHSEGFNSHAIMLMPELLFCLFIYLSLIKLFGLYQQGIVFTANHIDQLSNIGTCLMVWCVFDLFYPILLMLFLRLSGLSESLSLFISISSDQLFKLLVGLIIFVLSWIMTEAQKLQQEQELTI